MAEPGPAIAVVGGGIAGLAAAWEMVSRPTATGPVPRVTVLEAADRVGGRLSADSFAGRTVDLAADAFVARRPEAVALCAELGLDGDLVPPGATGASVWARGRLRPLPAALHLGVPTRWAPLARSGILSPAESIAVAGDLVRPHRRPEPTFGDRSVADIVASRLGRPVVDRLVDPLVGGIHAGSADELSAAALFPLLIAADHQPGSLMRWLRRAEPAGDPSSPVFLSLRTSMASLAESLAAELVRRGARLERTVRVDAVERVAGGRRGTRFVLALHPMPGGGDPSSGGLSSLEADAVVLATPARETAVLLAPLAPMAAGILSAMAHASVATITLALPPGTFGGRAGTGFLVPRTARIDGRTPLVTACTYLDRKWPHLAHPDHDLVRLSVGRHGDDRQAELGDDELVATATGELATMLATTAPTMTPIDALVTRWPAAFPQYGVGHLIRTAQITEDVDAVGGLALAGAAYRGVGIPACIGRGRDAARRLLDSLAAGGARTPAGR
jgi:protoporphyrinogen/coproporphyrinogen III oxidase